MLELDALHRYVVTEYQAGSAHRWKACLAASCIVGKYEKGATLSLASDLCLSVSQVENLAHAGLGWRWLRRYGITSEVRRRLTPSHFCAILDLFRRYEFSPYDAVSILLDAANEGSSVASMRDYVDGEYGDTLPAWVRRLDRITPQVERLINDYGVPEGVREAALLFLSSIRNGALQQHETNTGTGGGAAPLLE